MAERGFTVFFDNSSSQGGKQNKRGSSQGASSPRSSTPTAKGMTAGSNAEIPGLDMAVQAGASVGSLDDMLSLGREWVGHPYLSPSLVMQFGEEKAAKLISQRSGSSKRAIDCSGFAQEVLSYAGIDPPGDQTAEGLYKHFKANGTTLKSPQKGALVFFEPVDKKAGDAGTWDAGRSITHVAFASGDGKILDSSGGRGVTERALPPEGKFKYHYIMPHYKFNQKGMV